VVNLPDDICWAEVTKKTQLLQ